jgi:hypothetical protein
MRSSIVLQYHNYKIFCVAIFALVFLLSDLYSTANAQRSLQYLGQLTPGNTPKRFPPDSLLANDVWFWHGSPIFTPDGLEMYWTKIYQPGPGGQPIEIVYMKVIDSLWSAPQRPSFANYNYAEMNPFLSTSGDTMYFLSSRPGGWFFRSTRTTSGWSAPVALNIPLPPNSGFGNQFSVARNGTIYFELQDASNDDDICRSRLLNGIYQQPENLGNAINSEELDYMPFIDPDEKYLVFKSNRSEGRGLYISFNNEGLWSNAMNMGTVINQNTYGSLWPYVTLDNEYFFFCAGLAQDNGFNPYWVRASIIDSLRSVVSVIDEPESVPLYFQLNQNYPNPFNAETTISFELDQPANITLQIYDILGKKMQPVITHEFYQEGSHSFNFDASSLTSGIYIYKLTSSNGYSQIKKMCVLK